jgi:DNA-binding NtrC family response regulator
LIDPTAAGLESEAGAGRGLVVDDERNIRAALTMTLKGAGYMVDAAASGAEAEALMSITPPDVVMLDVRLPGADGLALLQRWKPLFPMTPVILMSGEATLSEALEGLKLGAYDFLEKPLLAPRLVNMVARAIERRTLLDQAMAGAVDGGDGVVGQSLKLKGLLADIAKIAPLKTRVLITGESGTGKDLVARAVHQLSARAKKRFVKLNCAAIPTELIESELFGHVKGAFTGAVQARRGHFEAANGGTLFLDEVGELSASAQAKMLRALQNGEITPVGSDVTIKVDVRVLAATNRDLKAEVELGHFREDLYYRLAVVVLEAPPLRDRTGDVTLLTRHFAELIRAENGLLGKTFLPEALDALSAYRWPGNIRELRNVVERLVILGGPTIGLDDLPPEIRAASRSPALPAGAPEAFRPTTWEHFKAASERAFLVKTLKACHGNISEAARILAVERTTIHKWLKTYDIEKRHYVV